MRIYDEFGVQHRQQLELAHYRLDAFLMHDARFQHFLHGKLRELLSLETIAGHAPHFSEASAANSILVFEE